MVIFAGARKNGAARSEPWAKVDILVVARMARVSQDGRARPEIHRAAIELTPPQEAVPLARTPAAAVAPAAAAVALVVADLVVAEARRSRAGVRSHMDPGLLAR